MLKKRPMLLQCAEMLLLFAALVAVDQGLMKGDAFSDLNPNPYWLPVLVMATTYGTGSGLAAAAIASAIWFHWSNLWSGATDHIEQQLRLSIQPMLWMVTALVTGEVTASRRNRLADQERQHQAMDRNWKKLAEIIARLTDTNRKLQVRIATEQRTIVQAMAAGLAVSKADPESQADALARLIALAAQTEDFTFYDVRGAQVTARFGGRAAMGQPPDLSRSSMAQAMLATPRPLRADRAADCPLLSESGILAVPVARTDEGLTAIILVHSAVGIRITEAYVAQLLQVADLLGQSPALFGREQASAAKWLVPEGKVA
ncbi:hypothetical protein M527_05970 [Sphingobium indicum IP26]|uniref:GAF domain-containing protein n=1 Tax=Sphingobium indicum F2 TaxID=1450518 RepID=A0A8E0WRV9_9SPHN|nr:MULTISPECIES: hypothetical protein [Sphingobium]EPR09672.1 hypothetical protein M527_05970 [Sphingobium indicum IP26]EQB04861.1 hypothetical protein L286_08810 [Sphingobium sp. HDIP04]KER36252.1 hypothetical protein AL00_12090 [Sphingobium indicum F2]KER38298.1 hypothetical protein AL00_00835 [Sphingobium indicum F2]